MPIRTIGKTEIAVTPVAMGCWPISGISSLNVTVEHSRRTIQSAVDAGINFFDLAYSYGYEGECECLAGEVLQPLREQVVIASKGGVAWQGRKRLFDAQPEVIRAQCTESLQRLRTDLIDLYYLHSPDVNVPVAETAGAFAELLDEGKIRAVGVSNATVDQLREFELVCEVAAVQPHFNMLQREIEEDLVPYCRERNISVVVYWPLMKGLLAGGMTRDHQFAPGDGRARYPMFQGEEWQRNHDFLDQLRPIADEVGCTLAQVVINWTIHRTGITAALCGARRPEQIEDTAASMNWKLTEDQTERINVAIAARGSIVSKNKP